MIPLVHNPSEVGAGLGGGIEEVDHVDGGNTLKAPANSTTGNNSLGVISE